MTSGEYRWQRASFASGLSVVLACSSSGTSTSGGTAPGDPAAPPSCAPTRDDGTRRLLARAEEAPPWMELDLFVTLGEPGVEFERLPIEERRGRVAPMIDDVEARLRALGARKIRRTWFGVGAYVEARHVAAIRCWPHVSSLSTNGVAGYCTPTPMSLSGPNPPPGPNDGPCVYECPVVRDRGAARCPDGCKPIVGDRVDFARGCVDRSAVMACGRLEASGGALTCYAREATNEAFAIEYPWLKTYAISGLRFCTASEGGATSPRALPACK